MNEKLCRTLRSETSIPIIMLTALTLEEDMLRGLNLGADILTGVPVNSTPHNYLVRSAFMR
jgi:DNA-binding response OmpR family regulator